MAAARQALSYQLRQNFTARQLADYIDDFIIPERLPDEQRKHERQLKDILEIVDQKKRHAQLANFLLDLKSEAEIKAIIRRKSLNN